ncbi:MAG: hypothetical protein AB7S26_08980 [Sandaracinaceae bacterium]
MTRDGSLPAAAPFLAALARAVATTLKSSVRVGVVGTDEADPLRFRAAMTGVLRGRGARVTVGSRVQAAMIKVGAPELPLGASALAALRVELNVDAVVAVDTITGNPDRYLIRARTWDGERLRTYFHEEPRT